MMIMMMMVAFKLEFEFHRLDFSKQRPPTDDHERQGSAR